MNPKEKKTESKSVYVNLCCYSRDADKHQAILLVSVKKVHLFGFLDR